MTRAARRKLIREIMLYLAFMDEARASSELLDAARNETKGADR